MKKYLLPGLVVLAFLAIGLWFVRDRIGLMSVQVVHPVYGSAAQAVYATGTVEATVMLPIAARTTARLVQLNADEGQDVKKGDVLAQLEDADLQSALQELRAQEDFARKDYERQAKLVKSGAIARSEYDRTKSNWDAAKAALARAEVEMDFLKLTAPDDGIILRRDGEIGQLIPASQPVFWFSCCAPLRISAEVDEEDIADVKVGQDVVIRADAFPGQVFKGKVQSITPKGDPVARSYRARIELTESTPLLIGMTAETNIVINQKDDALLLPASVLQPDNKIWLVREGRLVSTTVSVGIKGPEQIEIPEGVTEKDIVVLKPDTDLREGRAVQTTLAADK